MRRAENGETLVVEHSGRPKVVIISFDEYSKLKDRNTVADPTGERLVRARERYFREARDIHYDVEEDIRQMREERANELDHDLR
jgi:PHD/YefM family antitoxin component YafN of YafNO toxin-antitoxin module